MGGLYFGIFTDTESAAVGAIGAFLSRGLARQVQPRRLLEVMVETTATTAMVYGLIIGAQIFSFFVGVSTLTNPSRRSSAASDGPTLALISVILVGYLLLGTVMESFAVMIITVPIITPLVAAASATRRVVGHRHDVRGRDRDDPSAASASTCSCSRASRPTCPMWTIYKGVTPFVVADLIKLILMVLFPAITLWLPGTMHR